MQSGRKALPLRRLVILGALLSGTALATLALAQQFDRSYFAAAPLASAAAAPDSASGAAAAPAPKVAQAPSLVTPPGQCPGNPDALGTSRVIAFDPVAMPYVGSLQYKQTVPLERGEVVLTFDDGPLPPMTNRVLETLAKECVKATYFIVGTMARAHPAVLQRIHQDGHTIGTHSQTHPLVFPKLKHAAGLGEIAAGFASANAALEPVGAHTVPFFRFPGLGRTKYYEQYTKENGITVFSVDMVADDWMHLKPDEVMKRALDRLEARGSGILLLHDIQPATVVMLPQLLRELKKRNFKVVHLVAKEGGYSGTGPIVEPTMPAIAATPGKENRTASTAPAGAAARPKEPKPQQGKSQDGKSQEAKPQAAKPRPASPPAAGRPQTPAAAESTPQPAAPAPVAFSWPRLLPENATSGN